MPTGTKERFLSKKLFIIIVMVVFSSVFSLGIGIPPQRPAGLLPAFAEDNIFTDNVGIGTAEPVKKLDVVGTAGVGIGTTTAADSFTVSSAGNVGIGTTSPTQKLHVEGQCVTGDTLLPILRESEAGNQKPEARSGEFPVSSLQPLSSIEYLPITDVKHGDYVLSLNEEAQKIEPHRINGLLDMGVKPVFKLTTQSGRYIKTTGNHPYLVKLGAGSGEWGANTQWKKVAELKVGDEIAVAKDAVFLPINLSTMPGPGNQDGIAFPVKDNPIITNLKPEGVAAAADQALGITQGIGAPKVKFQLFNDSILDIFRQPKEFLFSLFSKIIQDHKSPAFLFTSSPQTRPDLREASNELKNSGLAASNSSSSSKSIVLSITNPNVLPLLSTSLIIPSKGNDNLNALEGSKSTIFSSANPLSKVVTIVTPPFYSPAKYITLLKNVSSYFAAEAEAVEITAPDTLWDRIVSIEFVGNEQVYDIEVEGTHNFIAGHWIENKLEAGSSKLEGNPLPSSFELPASSSYFFGGIIAHNTYLNGNVGIGSTVPLAKLDVSGDVKVSGTLTQGGTGVVDGSGSANYFTKWSDANTVAASSSVYENSGNVGIGTTSPTAKLHIEGNIKAKLQTDVAGNAAIWGGTGGSVYELGYDIAELFAASEEVELGDVLVIGSDGRLERSAAPYDTRVAGIVSAAPAILFEGSELQMAPAPFSFTKGSKPPLALVGRVLVKATAENGPIQPGDLLTTSSVPGYAMRAEEYRPGAILGKSLEPLEQGEGRIRALVTLQ